MNIFEALLNTRMPSKEEQLKAESGYLAALQALPFEVHKDLHVAVLRFLADALDPCYNLQLPVVIGCRFKELQDALRATHKMMPEESLKPFKRQSCGEFAARRPDENLQ